MSSYAWTSSAKMGLRTPPVAFGFTGLAAAVSSVTARTVAFLAGSSTVRAGSVISGSPREICATQDELAHFAHPRQAEARDVFNRADEGFKRQAIK